MDELLPYKLFMYEQGHHLVVLRPEQIIGFTTQRYGSYPAGPGVQDTRTWGVKLSTRDGQGSMVVDFGDCDAGRDSALTFVRVLREFLEQDAARNSHNASLRKGKING